MRDLVEKIIARECDKVKGDCGRDLAKSEAKLRAQIADLRNTMQEDATEFKEEQKKIKGLQKDVSTIMGRMET